MIEKEKLIKAFQRGEGEEIRIKVLGHGDRARLDVRLYATIEKPDSDPMTVPTKRGIRLYAELIDELLEGIEAARDYIEGRTGTANAE